MSSRTSSLLNEPTAAELKAAWASGEHIFFNTTWRDSGKTLGEWAWLCDNGAFWKHAALPVDSTAPDGRSWWDWAVEKTNAANIKGVISILHGSKVSFSDATLTNVLMALQKNKPSISRAEIESHFGYLVTPESLQYVGPLGETVMALVCSMGEPHLLRLALDQCKVLGISWDKPNIKQSGYWPLHYCTANTWAGGVKELVRAGANLSCRTADGCTPDELAEELGWKMYQSAVREGQGGAAPVLIPKATLPAAITSKPQFDLFA